MEKDDFKILDKALTEIIKKHGRNNLIELSEDTCIKRFPVESIAIGDLLGGGGLPVGRIIEAYGQNSNGKSLLAYYFAKQVQTLSDGFVVFLDYEYSFSNEFAIRNGVDTSKEKFLLIQPDNIEQGFDMLESLVKTGKVSFAICDSTNAMKSVKESDADQGSALMAVNARALGAVQRRIMSLLSQNNCTLMFISQIRDTMSQYSPQAIGTGKATAFNSSIRLEVKRIEYIENDNKEPIGIKMRIIGKKNKTATPNKEVIVDFYFDGGIDVEKEITDYAIKFETIKKMGSWYELPNTQRVQGKDSVSDLLKKDKVLFDTVRDSVYKYLGALNMKTEEVSQENTEPTPPKRVSKKDKPIDESVLASIGGSNLEEVEPVNEVDTGEVAV